MVMLEVEEAKPSEVKMPRYGFTPARGVEYCRNPGECAHLREDTPEVTHYPSRERAQEALDLLFLRQIAGKKPLGSAARRTIALHSQDPTLLAWLLENPPADPHDWTWLSIFERKRADSGLSYPLLLEALRRSGFFEGTGGQNPLLDFFVRAVAIGGPDAFPFLQVHLPQATLDLCLRNSPEDFLYTEPVLPASDYERERHRKGQSSADRLLNIGRRHGPEAPYMEVTLAAARYYLELLERDLAEGGTQWTNRGLSELETLVTSKRTVFYGLDFRGELLELRKKPGLKELQEELRAAQEALAAKAKLLRKLVR